MPLVAAGPLLDDDQERRRRLVQLGSRRLNGCLRARVKCARLCFGPHVGAGAVVSTVYHDVPTL